MDVDTRLHRVFGAKVFGTMLCAQEAVRRISTAHGGAGGAIVNVSPAASPVGSSGKYIDCAASKGAIDSFTIGPPKEMAGQGIQSNAMRPGFIRVDIHAASGGEPGQTDSIGSAIPLRRGGEPGEVANAILQLLSP